MPFPGYNIHLVNEAYGIPPGWLQSSLYRSVSKILPAHGVIYKLKPKHLNEVFMHFYPAASTSLTETVTIFRLCLS